MKKIDELITRDNIKDELLIKEVLNQPDVKAFINANHMTISQVRDAVSVFMAFSDKLDACKKCHKLEDCGQNITGNGPVLVFDDGHVYLDYATCATYGKENLEKNRYRTLKTLFIKPEKATLESLYQNPNREKLQKKVLQFIMNYEDDPKQKGIYVHGPYGSGKTYFMSFLAYELSSRNHSVYFVYFPELVRNIRAAIGTNSFEKEIDEMKRTEILILDDLGGETNSSFVRDEILGPVLQARMVNKMPVFITSNYGENDLVEHFAESKTNMERIKASRIFERIRTICDIVPLQDKNYR